MRYFGDRKSLATGFFTFLSSHKYVRYIVAFFSQKDNGMYLMEKNDKYHVVIKSDEGSKLKYKKDDKGSEKLPAHVGTIFRSKEEIKEDRMSFKDFLQ